MNLRDYQSRAIEAVYSYFEHSDGNPVVCAPTGSGKSVLIGALCRDILTSFPNQRLLVLSHVKELLEQNYGKIKAFWPDAPAGLYCAALGQRRARDRITVASIQSVHRKAAALGWRDLIFIDECHLLSPNSETMYQRFIADMRSINRRVKVVGFTATPYRLKTGLLTEGPNRLFTDVCIEISLAELLAAGHVASLVSKPSVIQADLSKVRITGGEFNAGDMERELDQEELTRAALDEVFALGGERKSWLVFCSGIKHARHVAEAIRERGVTAATVTGDTPIPERDAILRALKSGEVQAVTNANCLTTGFDAPNIDLVVLLRPTTSPGLYVQMLGRGMRTHPGKQNCLVLDYAGNVERHGPVTHVRPPRAASKKKKQDRQPHPACQVCPQCRTAAQLAAGECPECGFIFEQTRPVRHAVEASALAVMSLGPPTAGEWVEVDKVRYSRHERPGKIPSLRVDYHCGLRRYSEWVCLAHPPGFPRDKAQAWWRTRCGTPPPDNIGTALMESVRLAEPDRIRIRPDGKFWEITAYDFDGPKAKASNQADGNAAA